MSPSSVPQPSDPGLDSESALLNAMLAALEQGISDANATRYLTAIGTIMLLYDHFLTFSDEVTLIWPARPTFAKYAFLLNRYIVAGSLLAWQYPMSGLTTQIFSDYMCQSFITAIFMLGIVSVELANVLVLLRVVRLWDRDRRIMRIVMGGFLASLAVTVVMVVITLVRVLPGVQYSPFVHICITTTRTPFLAGVWASPMVFEVFMLILTCWNAFDRPRTAHTRLTHALYRDGISFFLGLLVLRILNLTLAAVAPPSLTLLGVIFVWATTTVVLSRSLIRLHHAESGTGTYNPKTYYTNGRASPFDFEAYGTGAADGPYENENEMDNENGNGHENEQVEIVSAWY